MRISGFRRTYARMDERMDKRKILKTSRVGNSRFSEIKVNIHAFTINI